jgi:hypothetical protein
MGLVGVALACLSSLQQVQAAQDYGCTVEDFTTFDQNDTAFITANKRKTFRITRDGQSLTVVMESQDFQGTTDTYSIEGQTFDELVAFEDGSNATVRLVMPLRPEHRIEREGFFNATISLQYNFVTNSWLLRCRG